MNTLERISETGRSGIWSDNNRIDAVIRNAETYSGYLPVTEAQESVFPDTLFFTDEALGIMAGGYESVNSEEKVKTKGSAENNQKADYGTYLKNAEKKISANQGKAQLRYMMDNTPPVKPQPYWPATDRETEKALNTVFENYEKEKNNYEKELKDRLIPMNKAQFAKVQESIDLIKSESDKNGNGKYAQYGIELQRMLNSGSIYMDKNLSQEEEGKRGTKAECGDGFPFIKGGDIKFSSNFLDENCLRDKWEAAGILVHEYIHHREGDFKENHTYSEQFNFLKESYEHSNKDSKTLKEALLMNIDDLRENKKVKLNDANELKDVVYQKRSLDSFLKDRNNFEKYKYLLKNN